MPIAEKPKNVLMKTNDGILLPDHEGQNATAAASETGKNSSESATIDSRHCAYCLQVCPLPVKLCSGCKRRAYCSRKCQVIDWKVGKSQVGQGHKNWCQKFNYCEEDIDWEVVPVPGKGLGIVAKKPIPCKRLIIVEPPLTYPYNHPAIMELQPEGASLEKKISLNLLEANESSRFRDHVALRISRLNHSCKPNAGVVYDDGARCEIVYAERDIQPGEEICVPYLSTFKDGLKGGGKGTSWMKVDDYAVALERQRYEFMMSEWGFVCPNDCFCRQSSTKELLIRNWRLSEELSEFLIARKGFQALECNDKILKIQDELSSSLMSKANLHQYSFQIATLFPVPSHIAYRHIREAYNTFRVLIPYSTTLQEVELYMKTTALNATFD